MSSSLVIFIFARGCPTSRRDVGFAVSLVTLEPMNVNFAERAHNHNWKLDPIVRSLLDTDFYKLLMLQFVWKNFPAVRVTSEVVNRTTTVRLAEHVSTAMLVD